MQSENKPRIGVINWDAGLPETTYFGGYATRSLSEPEFRDRVPFYADFDGGHLSFHLRTQEEFDREAEYAIAAGIDYFAHCWYRGAPFDAGAFPAEKIKDYEPHLEELSHVRKLHAASRYRDRLKLCAILVYDVLEDFVLQDLAQQMTEDSYERFDGRPLVYFFGGYNGTLIRRMRRFAREAGAGEIYAVFFNNGVQEDVPGETPEADAISCYNCGKGNIHTQAELTEANLRENEDRRKFGLPVIPTLSVGWNPMPRMRHHAPWVDYGPIVPFAPPAQAGELEARARAYRAAVDAAPEAFPTGHYLCFAWNEFEEGGWLCPTRDAAGHPDTAMLDEFSRAVKILKQ